MLMPRSLRCLVLSLAFLGVVGCTPYSAVKEKRLKAKPVSLASVVMKRAQGKPKKDPVAQIGRYLNAASLAASRLEVRPDHPQARLDYNFAIGRIFEIIHEAQLEPWKEPLQCPGLDGDWIFTVKPEGKSAYDPSQFRVRPADRFEFKGRLVKERSVKEGLGAPMVATSREGIDFTKTDRFIMGNRLYYGMTVVLDFKGNRCTARYLDPLSVENVTLGGHEYPLAADFTAPIGMALAELKPRKVELERLIRPDRFAGTSRLARLQPYDPNKIPVLCIHGLGDSQATWSPMIAALRADPVVRQNYQFWFYSYPTGYPYPMMAADLRKELDQMTKTYPGHKKWVVIGHSMGGMIARELITTSGMKIWNAYFEVPPAKLPISKEGRDLLTHTLIFKARHDISRVIFTSASLRGSDMAAGFLGKLGKKIIGNSLAALGTEEDTMTAVSLAKPGAEGEPILAMPNSIDALDPSNRFLLTINDIPPDRGIPYHSIIGDRGKGGNLDRTKPVSTDGLVPYWSSHIDGAESEIIIPSGHWSNQHPLAIAEVRRILMQHIGRR